MSKRYVIKLLSDVDGIVEYRVAASTDQPVFEQTKVWISNGVPRCTRCSGIIAAMSASCRHVKAVKRFLSKRAAEQKGASE